MKISINDVELFTLNEIQKKVIMDYIPSDIFEDDMKRRLNWVLMHLYEQAFKQLKERNEILLQSNEVSSVPTDPDKFAELIFSLQGYQDRLARDKGGTDVE